MDINIQQLLVSLFLLVPGFISTEIQKSYSPKRFENDFHWVVSSLLTSLVINAVLIFFILFFGEFRIDTKVSEVSSLAKEISLLIVGLYVILLYGVSVLWGILSGAYPLLGLKAFLNHFGIVPYAQNPSVWDRIFEVRRPKERPITWLKFKNGNDVYLAHLRHSSTHVEMDKSFEIYVDRVHLLEKNNWVPCGFGQNPDHIPCDGMYFRITPESFIELYFQDTNWNPNKSIQPIAKAPAD